MKYQGLHVHVHVLQVSLCFFLSLVSRYFLVSLMLTFPHKALDIRRPLVFQLGGGLFH